MILNNKNTIVFSGSLLNISFIINAIYVFLNPSQIFGIESYYINIILAFTYFMGFSIKLFARRSAIDKYNSMLLILLFIFLLLNFKNATIQSFLGILSLTVLLGKEVIFPVWLIDLLHTSIFLYFAYDYFSGTGLSLSKELYILPGQDDLNFSAYITFLYFLFSFKIKSVLGILLSLLISISSLSRACSLSIFVFLAIILMPLVSSKISFLKKPLLKLKKLFVFFIDRKRFLVFYIIIAFNIFIYIYGAFLSSYLSANSEGISRDDSARIYSLKSNEEDKYRYLANSAYIDYLLKNPQTLIVGNPELSLDQAYDIGGIPTPHNAFLFSTLLLGLPFLIVYLLILSSIFSRFESYSSLAFVISSFIFSLFLHVGYSVTQHFVLFCIISIHDASYKQSWSWLRGIPFGSVVWSLLPRRFQAR